MSLLKFPPYIQKGDKAIIISPSGPIDKMFLKESKKKLESWGLKVVTSKHANGSSGRFSGTEKQRLRDMQHAMDDENAKVIFCSRGGYGAVHLIDKIDFTAFKKHPKWLVGYSDITLLHELFQYNGYASLHAPMSRHLAVEPEEDICIQFLKSTLFGSLPDYTWESHKLNRKGIARGVLRRGNLSVIYGIRGTCYDIPPEGTILFIEDIGERPYHIDRMMNNLKLGGIMEKISGLIVGQFTEYDEDTLMGKEVYERIAELVKDYDYPVCFNFPIGHDKLNYPLICGATAELNVMKRGIELKIFDPIEG